MRPWPVLQICFAVLLLGAAWMSLHKVMGTPDVPTDGGSASNRAEPADTDVAEAHLQIEFSRPVALKKVSWGTATLATTPLSSTTWTASAISSSEPIRIEGTVSPEQLPLALRLEVETDGHPTREKIFWIRRPGFSVAYHPAES